VDLIFLSVFLRNLSNLRKRT